MKTFSKIPLAITTLALIWTLAGCGGNTEPETSPVAMSDNSAPMADDMKMATDTSAKNGATLGIEEKAGPFQVTLTTVPVAPKVGDAKFGVTVMRDGKPVTDATMKLNLTMPSMNMGGPSVTLQHKAAGVYEGSAKLGMGGAYQGEVVVNAGGDTGTALYDFSASQ